jgi:hypothetical protein
MGLQKFECKQQSVCLSVQLAYWFHFHSLLTRTIICTLIFRAVQSGDVSLKIIYCGVCYADVAWTRNKLNDSKYPLVPG